MELFVFWVICAIVSAIIASSKNRSAAGWFFIGLFLGLFSLLLVCVLPTVKEEAPAADAAPTPAIDHDMKKCPFGAELVKSEAIKCKHCGTDLTQAAA